MARSFDEWTAVLSLPAGASEDDVNYWKDLTIRNDRAHFCFDHHMGRIDDFVSRCHQAGVKLDVSEAIREDLEQAKCKLDEIRRFASECEEVGLDPSSATQEDLDREKDKIALLERRSSAIKALSDRSVKAGRDEAENRWRIAAKEKEEEQRITRNSSLSRRAKRRKLKQLADEYTAICRRDDTDWYPEFTEIKASHNSMLKTCSAIEKAAKNRELSIDEGLEQLAELMVQAGVRELS